MSGSNSYLKAVLDSGDDVVCVVDPGGRILLHNHVMEEILRKSPGEGTGLRCYEVFHGTACHVEGCPVLRMWETRTRECLEVQLEGKLVKVIADPLFDENAQLVGAAHIMTDITRMKEAEGAMAERAALTSLSSEVGFTLTEINTLENILQKTAGILVRSLDVSFARIWIFNHKEDILELKASAGMYTSLDGGYGRIPLDAPLKIAHIARTKTPHLTNDIIGDPLIREQEWARREGMAAFAGYPLVIDRKTAGVMGLFARHSLTEFVLKSLGAIADGLATTIKRKQLEEKLLRNAFYDELTELPNRSLFIDRLSVSLKQTTRTKNHLSAVLYLDLDRFKIINESIGHEAGNNVLREISKRLGKCLRPGDTVGRMGADEFAVLLDHMGNTNDALMVAGRIQKEIGRSIRVGEHEVFCKASIGIAPGSGAYKSPEDLLRDAEMAMTRAKLLGRDRCVLFDESMHEKTIAFFNTERDLRLAVERNEFRVYYQPIMLLESERIAGFEALIRWQHPELGLILPSEFIGVAEETGLIIPIGEWILREACRQMKQWHTQYSLDPVPFVNVNLSARQFSQSDLVQRVEAVLRETGLDPRHLKLEVTETAAMEDAAFAVEVLRRLKDLGIQLSIDDFGTGYSSLSYLRRFPIDSLKIDRSFVSRIDASQEDAEIVRAITNLAHGLGVKLVAEGIETENQLSQLKGLRCEYGQGYLFSRPLNESAAISFALGKGRV